jgi:hypothetical protein
MIEFRYRLCGEVLLKIFKIPEERRSSAGVLEKAKEFQKEVLLVSAVFTAIIGHLSERHPELMEEYEEKVEKLRETVEKLTCLVEVRE